MELLYKPLSKPLRDPFASSFLIVAFALALATLVSCLSGFEGGPVPFEFKWQISPLGLLLDFNPELSELETVPGFSGTFAPTFDYLIVFLQTCLLEAPFYWLIFRKKGLGVFFAALAVGNVLTHPMIYFVFPYWVKNYLGMALAAEVFAPVLEAIFVCWGISEMDGESLPSYWAASSWVILANLFSWQMGAFI